jgi:hypothetical protein
MHIVSGGTFLGSSGYHEEKSEKVRGKILLSIGSNDEFITAAPDWGEATTLPAKQSTSFTTGRQSISNLLQFRILSMVGWSYRGIGGRLYYTAFVCHQPNYSAHTK